MYYDTYRGRNRRRRRSCLGWLIGSLMKLISLVLVLAILAAALVYAIPPSFLNIEDSGANLSLTDGLPGSRVNILLLGIDFLKEGQQRSDSMMVASFGYNSLRLTSIMRDTMVTIPGQPGLHKINSAFSYGGAEMAMRVVNETFGLNITNYICIDFSSMVDLVDAIGGIDIEVEAGELQQLNSIAYNTYKKIIAVNPDKYAHYAASQPYTQAGELHLNGLFATGYARIRQIDSDYMRASRQRRVLSAVLKQVRERIWDPNMYAGLYNVLKDSVSTNLSWVELISLGEKALVAGKMETDRMPHDEHIADSGSAIDITDPQGCVTAMRNFLYAEKE